MKHYPGDMILECPKCSNIWMEKFMLPMKLTALADRLMAWSCTSCGNKRGIALLTGKKYFAAKKSLEAE